MSMKLAKYVLDALTRCMKWHTCIIYYNIVSGNFDYADTSCISPCRSYRYSLYMINIDYTDISPCYPVYHIHSLCMYM